MVYHYGRYVLFKQTFYSTRHNYRLDVVFITFAQAQII